MKAPAGVALPVLLLLAGCATAFPPAATLSTAVVSPSAEGAKPTTASSDAASPSAVASNVFVERAIVDRPGVPAAVYDRYWTARTQAGQVGTTARIVLPPGEAIFGADAGRVASIAVDENGHPISGANGVTIIVRDIRSGGTVQTVDSSIVPTYGLIIGSLMFWTGFGLLADEERVDGGVWTIDLQDPSAAPRSVIDNGDDLATFGRPASRQPLRISASGNTLISAVVGPGAERTDVIDVPSLTVRTTIDGMGLGATDAAVLVVHEAWAFTATTRLALVDLGTGREVGDIWHELLQGTAPFQNTEVLVYATVAGDAELFVSFPRGRDAVIVAVAGGSGHVREILVQRDAALWLNSEISSPSQLVLLPDFDVASSLGANGQAEATLLDPATGELQLDAFTLIAP